MTEEELRLHVALKRDLRELPDEVAERMIALLDAGAEPDYQALYTEACWPAPGDHLYHCAPSTARSSIETGGLRPGGPRHGKHWGSTIVPLGQPIGVYLGPLTQAERGVWAHWMTWDVWQVDVRGLDLERDGLNRGCWYAVGTVPPERLTLLGSYSLTP